MFSKNKEVLNLMVDALGDNVHQRRRENKIWFKGRLVKYPFENDLAALPPQDNFDCIYGYIVNPHADDVPTNLAEWSYKTFGAGISEKYFIPYNEKIWNYPATKLGLEFVERIPKPPMEDVLKSSIGISTEGYLHQLHFYYPIEGGYESLVHAFANERARRDPHELARGLRRARRQTLARDVGRWRRAHVRHARLHAADSRTAESVDRRAATTCTNSRRTLRYNSLINVLIGCNEDRGYPYTALYVPDPELLFHRLSFPKAFSEHCVPDGIVVGHGGDHHERRRRRRRGR